MSRAEAEEHSRKGMSLTFLALTRSSKSQPKVMTPVTGALSKSLAKEQVLVLGVLQLLVQKPAK